MTNKNFLSNIRSPFLDSPSSDVGHRRRVVADLLPSFCRVNMLKLVSILVLMLTLGVGNAWGASPATLTFTAACGGSGTDSDGNTWTVTSDAAESQYDGTKGIHYGTGKIAVSYLNLTTSGISGTITQIQVNASGASGTSAKLNVTVGGSPFGSQQSLTSSATTYTLTGSASGNIVVAITQSSTTKALYCKSVTVTYSSGAAYTITATRNNNSYGTVSVTGTTITATPSTCYQVASGAGGYTVTSGTATVSHTGTSNTLTVTPSSNCTVQVNFEKQTVNTYVDEIQGNSDIEDCGTHDAPSLDDEDPASSGSCAEQHWHFMGWVTAANKANPTDLNIIAPGTEMTASGATYYAVWAKGTSGGGFDNSAGGTFKIYADVSGTKYYATGTGSKITASTDASDAAEYVFEKQSAGVYYIKTGTDYVTYSSSTNLGTSASGYSWTVTAGTKGSWRLTSETSGRGFIFRSGTGFGGYSTSNVTAGGTEYYDVEIGGGYEYSDYMCTCCTELATINGSFL